MVSWTLTAHSEAEPVQIVLGRSHHHPIVLLACRFASAGWCPMQPYSRRMSGSDVMQGIISDTAGGVIWLVDCSAARLGLSTIQQGSCETWVQGLS